MFGIILYVLIFIVLYLLSLTITYWKGLISGNYGIVLLYGIMGSGKTTLLQKWIYKFSSKGGRIYTNYLMTGAQIYDPKLLGHVKFPENSLIIVDEAATLFNNRAGKDTEQEFLHGLKDIRKNKNRIVFVSQNTDIDKQIRDAAHRIYILKKTWLFSTAKLVLKIMEITNNSGDSSNSNGGDIIYKFAYGGIFSGEFTFLPRWSYGFDSFETITDLPAYETYNVDPHAYEVLDRKHYRRYNRRFVFNRGKDLLSLPYRLLKNKSLSNRLKKASNEEIEEEDDANKYFVL